MARKPTGKPNGRPLKTFDQKTFENLCFIWCTLDEMENILEANRDTISAWCERTYGESFSVVYKRFSDGGKASLRRNQLHLSKTNASMCIWLGKQKLDQKDDPKPMDSFSGELKDFIDFLKLKYTGNIQAVPVADPAKVKSEESTAL